MHCCLKWKKNFHLPYLLNCEVFWYLSLAPGPEEFMNWTEWTELNKLNEGSWPSCPKLNWTNWQSTQSGRRTELNKLLLNDFERNLHHSRHHTTSWMRKQAQPANLTIPPPRQQTLGWQAGISAGGDPWNCFSAPPNNWRLDGLNWAWNKLNWMEAFGSHAPNWTEQTFPTNWWLGNSTVLSWCQTI